MVDFFAYSDGDHSLFSASSGTIVKVYKDNGDFKIIKTNKPNVYGTVALTATPYNPLYYEIDYIDGSDEDRAGALLPSANPTITIYDTDILRIDVSPDAVSAEYRMALYLNDQTTLVTENSISNNITGNGTIRWYPGAGNTGTFYYLYYDSVSSPFGGQINVIATPS